jgi:hypothetical protein
MSLRMATSKCLSDEATYTQRIKPCVSAFVFIASLLFLPKVANSAETAP